jgi:hypothetical protein
MNRVSEADWISYERPELAAYPALRGAAEHPGMRAVVLLAVAASVGAACYFLINSFLGEGAAAVLTAPAVLFTVFALGVGLR